MANIPKFIEGTAFGILNDFLSEVLDVFPLNLKPTESEYSLICAF